MPAPFFRRVSGEATTGGGTAASLLLDTYPGAVAAYSLRKLRTDYAGSCIRVRESDGDTEADIGFAGGVMDEASLLAHCGANDGRVVDWYNQGSGGSTFDVSQSVAANQTYIVSSGSVLVDSNGLPWISGTASGQSLISGDNTEVSAQPYTVFIVGKAETNDTNKVYARDNGSQIFFDGNTTAAYAGSYVQANPDQGTTPCLLDCLFNGASSDIYINNTEVGSGDAGTNAWNGMRIDSVNCKWQEIIIFSGDKSADRAAIRAALNSYYGIY